MIGYYSRFIKGYPTVLVPLTDLLRKYRKWEWSSVCEQAFNSVKFLLCDGPILWFPAFTQSFVLSVEVSRVGVGAVLLQEGKDKA